MSGCLFPNTIFLLGAQSVNGNCRLSIMLVARRFIAEKTTRKNSDRSVTSASKKLVDLLWYGLCYNLSCYISFSKYVWVCLRINLVLAEFFCGFVVLMKPVHLLNRSWFVVGNSFLSFRGANTLHEPHSLIQLFHCNLLRVIFYA